MQIVINIDEVIYKRILPYKDVPVISNLANDFPEIIHAIANGVPIPTGHGRLIDADALLKDVKDNSESYFADDFAHEWVDIAPTIIEADEVES